MNITIENIEIFTSSSKVERYLMTLEALLMRDLVLGVNTKDEYR